MDFDSLSQAMEGLESLPAMLQRTYGLIRELDTSLQASQRQNEERCEQEIIEIKHKIDSGDLSPDILGISFSDEAIDEQKHCVRIADEKVALATQAYDMVDAHIQQLDQFMRKMEELRQEREMATSASSGVNPSSTTKSGRTGSSGRGGRKKARLAPVMELQPHIDLELPVDPNEPTYCICNQVSYGEMVACDNPDCKIEWFHFGCVGLKEQPKGKWYCPNCIGLPKRKKSK
ncbi:hypothetical protein HPP92_016876 [Vanilla planifolia]|uniref:PHD finger protein ING n=1 Tax=Vanilla planifolia TaxID=51239 RepID=A0A835UTS8_VANPL|nr:hypothetical protein HPP92_016876 [Vanilla planifolia]